MRPCVGQQVQRIPRQQPRNAAVLGTIHDQYGNAVFGANVCATERANNKPYCTSSNGEGIFRLMDIPAGEYQLVVEAEGVKTASPQSLTLAAGQMQAVDIRVEVMRSSVAGANAPSGLPGPAPRSGDAGSFYRRPYPGLRSPQPSEMAMLTPEVVPGDQENFSLEPYRWTVAMPAWQRLPGTRAITLTSKGIGTILSIATAGRATIRSSARIGSSSLPAPVLPASTCAACRFRVVLDQNGPTVSNSLVMTKSRFLDRLSFSPSICFAGTPPSGRSTCRSTSRRRSI